MGDFGFDIKLLISLVEARPVLWDKTEDIYKDINDKDMESSLYLSSRRLRSSRRCGEEEEEEGKKTLLVIIAMLF